jgi:hypothetical protein
VTTPRCGLINRPSSVIESEALRLSTVVSSLADVRPDRGVRSATATAHREQSFTYTLIFLVGQGCQIATLTPNVLSS